MARYDFSTAWGSKDTPATEQARPFSTDDDAKAARDAFAEMLKALGVKVRKSTLRNQRREYWGWQEPCGISCTVYQLEAA